MDKMRQSKEEEIKDAEYAWFDCGWREGGGITHNQNLYTTCYTETMTCSKSDVMVM